MSKSNGQGEKLLRLSKAGYISRVVKQQMDAGKTEEEARQYAHVMWFGFVCYKKAGVFSGVYEKEDGQIMFAYTMTGEDRLKAMAYFISQMSHLPSGNGSGSVGDFSTKL